MSKTSSLVFRRRRLLVAIVTVVTVSLLSGAWVLQSKLRDSNVRRLLPEAQAAWQRGDSESAVMMLERYLQRYPEDIPVLTNYAEVRTEVALPGGRHILAAIDVRQRIARLLPTDAENTVALLRLYDQAAQSTEALKLGETLLKTSPDDVEILMIVARHQARTRYFTESRQTLDRLLEIDPLYLPAHEMTLRLFRERNQSVQSYRSFASELLVAHPDAPEARIAAALAYAMIGDGIAAEPLADQAAKEIDGKLDRFRLLTMTYDQIGQFRKATELSEKALSDPRLNAVAALAIRRLWEARRFGVLAGLEWDEQGSPRGAGAMRHLLALARFSTKSDPSETIANYGENVQGEYGKTWASLLPFITGQAKPTAAELEAFRKALNVYPYDPQLTYFVGELLLSSGAAEEAVRVLSRAAQLSPTWPAPYKRLSQALRASGRGNLSLAPAYAALQRAPQDADLVLNLLEAAAINLDQFSTDQIVALQTAYEGIDPERKIVTLAPLDVALASATQGVEAARQRLDGWLPRVGELTPLTLWALLGVSEQAALSREIAIIEQTAQQRGIDPMVATMWASVVSSQQSVEDGWNLFEKERARHRDDVAWQLATADLATKLGRDDAADRWKQLLAAYPDRADVLRGILKNRGLTEQSALLLEAVERLEAKVGSDDFAVRWARVKIALAEATTERALSEAVGNLAELTDRFPWLFEPQWLMARSQVRLKNWTLAAQSFGTAYKLAPHRWDMRLEEARVLNLAGQREIAVGILQAEESSGLQDPARVAAHAKLWLAWERFEDARRVIDAYRGAVDPRSDLGRLKMVMSAASGNRAEAIAGAQSLMTSGKDTDLLAAINILGRMGATDQLMQAGGYLADADMSESQRQLYTGIIAGYRGDLEAAQSAYAAAVRDPKLADETARQWLMLSLRATEPAVFVNATESLAETPLTDPVLGQVIDRGSDLEPSLTSVVRVLLVEMMQNTLDAGVGWGVIDGMAAAGGDQDKWSSLVVETRQKSQRYAKSAGLRQALILAAYQSQQMSTAAQSADQAAQLFPQDILIRQLQLAIHLELRNWERVTEVGKALAELGPNGRALGLLASSEAWVQLNDGDAALKTLESLAQTDQIDLLAHDVLRRSWLRARMMRGDDPNDLDGVKLFSQVPTEQVVSLVGTMMLTPSSRTSGEVWADWFTRQIASSPHDSSPRVVLALASWWRLLHEAHGDAALGERAIPLLARVRDDSQVGLMALLLEGQLFELLSRDEEAKVSYLELLRRQSENVVAMNNLAMVLSRLGESDKAVVLAERALKAAPQAAALHDTHAEALRTAGRPVEAVAAARRAVEAMPQEIEFQVTLGFALCDADRLTEAQAVVADLEPRRQEMNERLRERFNQLKQRIDNHAMAVSSNTTQGEVKW